MKLKVSAAVAAVTLIAALSGCAEAPETAESRRAKAICGGSSGVADIELDPAIKAPCDTVAHAEQAVREQRANGQAAVEFERAKEVTEAQRHREVEAEVEAAERQ